MGQMDQLEKVVKTPGISGREKTISKLLKEYYAPYCDEIIYDNLGSIYGVIKSEKENPTTVLVTAHMDELGFIVKKIEETGLIRGLIMGKIEPNSLLGQEVHLYNRQGKAFPGVILGRNKANQVQGKEDVLLDFGFSSKEEALSEEVSLGDMVTFAPKFTVSKNGKEWIAPNWNGRISVNQTIDLLRQIYENQLSFPFDLYVGCTVQEQVGARGAQTAANLVAPDLTIILDTNQAWDYQEDAGDVQGELSKGVLLTYYDPSVLPNRLPMEELRKICEEAALPYQYYFSLEDSDGAWFNKLRTGCPVLFMNMPVRNMNTAAQVVSQEDYETVGQAIYLFLKDLDEAAIVSFKEENR